MSQVVMVVKGSAQPGKRGEVQAAFEQHLAPRADANDAQQVVVWAADENDADTFYLFEVYRDAAAVQENSQAPWFGEYMAAVGPLLAGQPEFGMATPKWSKGI